MHVSLIKKIAVTLACGMWLPASFAAEETVTIEKSASPESQSEIVIPLYKETVKVGKRTVDAAQIRVRKIVKTETFNQPVQLRREIHVIDRATAKGEVASTKNNENSIAGNPFEEKEIVIQLKEEEPVVEK